MTEDEAPRGDGWRVVAMVAALVLGHGVFGYYLGWRHALGPEADARVAEVEGRRRARAALLETRRALARAARPDLSTATRAGLVARAAESMRRADVDDPRLLELRRGLLDPGGFASASDTASLRRAAALLDEILDEGAPTTVEDGGGTSRARSARSPLLPAPR